MFTWIQSIRTPLLDDFFRCLDWLDRPLFFFLAVGWIWLFYGFRPGVRFFYLLFISKVLNDALKTFFAWPRPSQIDPSVGLVVVKGFGFPSGGAETAALLSGLLLVYWKNRWKWVVVPIYFSLLSFSRIYLGVHFPVDILGGWIVGFSLCVAYVYLETPLEKVLLRQKRHTVLAISQIFPLIALLFSHSPVVIYLSGTAMTFGWIANRLIR